MFTGIIEEIGRVIGLEKKSDSLRIKIETTQIASASQRGDRISVNGVCLTAKVITNNIFEADVMAETVSKTNLKSLVVNNNVNLERALTPSKLIGGHLVQGHIDNVGKVSNLTNMGEYWVLEVEATQDVMKYLVNKASVALNGISLTLSEVTNNSFKVYIIPTTYTDTNVKFLKKGDFVNIEVDMMGKYVYHYLNKTQSSNISEEFLRENGF